MVVWTIIPADKKSPATTTKQTGHNSGDLAAFLRRKNAPLLEDILNWSTLSSYYLQEIVSRKRKRLFKAQQNEHEVKKGGVTGRLRVFRERLPLSTFESRVCTESRMFKQVINFWKATEKMCSMHCSYWTDCWKLRLSWVIHQFVVCTLAVKNANFLLSRQFSLKQTHFVRAINRFFDLKNYFSWVCLAANPSLFGNP